MSEDGVLSARNGSESVKKIKKYSNDTDLIKNKDYDADEILRKKINMLDPTKIYKNIRDIRKQNCE